MATRLLIIMYTFTAFLFFSVFMRGCQIVEAYFILGLTGDLRQILLLDVNTSDNI